DPDQLAAWQVQIGREAELGAGELAHGRRRLEVPGQVAVVVADGVDDVAAPLGHRGEGAAEIVVRVQDVPRGDTRVRQHLHDVPGQHHRQRAGLGRQPTRKHLTAPAGDDAPLRRQVQVADGDDLAVRRYGYVEPIGDIWLWRSHEIQFLPPACFHHAPGPGRRVR